MGEGLYYLLSYIPSVVFEMFLEFQLTYFIGKTQYQAYKYYANLYYYDGKHI